MKSLTLLAALSSLIPTVPAVHSQNADHILKELVQPRPAVADADNGWVEAQKLVVNHPRDRKGWKKDFMVGPGEEQGDQEPGVNLEVLKEYQEANRAALATMRKILTLPGWQAPRPEGRWPASLMETNDNRILLPARLIMAEAMVEVQKGRLDKAWPDIMAVMKLGRRIAESGGMTMDTLKGMTLMSSAARMAAWAGRQAPDAATARRMAADLEAFEGYSDIYQRALEGELYHVVKKCELYQADGEELKQTLVHRHVIMDSLQFAQSSLAEWNKSVKGKIIKRGESLPEWKIPDYPYEENLAKWLKNPPEEVLLQIEAIKQTDWVEYTRQTVEQFKKSRLIKPVTLADYRKPQQPARDRDEEKEKTEAEDTSHLILINLFRGATAVRQARTSLLLRAWMYDHRGELPASLDALVPDYMPALPVDPFDGKTMRYRKDKLWSTGGDLKDEGGDNAKDTVLPL